MDIREEIIKIAKIKKQLRSSDVVKTFNVSRQYAAVIIRGLVNENKLIKIGSTNKAFYILPEFVKQQDLYPLHIKKRLKNRNLSEHEVLDTIENQYTILKQLPENVLNIFTYAFSEILNNAIEHSKSKDIDIEVSITNGKLTFIINDFGIGVFRNVMKKNKLKNELEAIQDILKGKTTTKPREHTGEGIFFTSKVGDVFTLESFGFLLVVNNKTKNIYIQKPPIQKQGTKAKFTITVNSNRHVKDVFVKFAEEETDFGFDKTEIKVKLYSTRGVYVSRSQARRVLVGLDKFKSVILDFENVSMVGQAFADEVFRVFKNKYPDIKLIPINMEEHVQFMIERASPQRRL